MGKLGKVIFGIIGGALGTGAVVAGSAYLENRKAKKAAVQVPGETEEYVEVDSDELDVVEPEEVNE